MKRLLVAAIASGLCLLSAGVQAQSRYSITDLSGLTAAGDYVRWTSINNSGDLGGIVRGDASTYIGGQLTSYADFGGIERPVLGNSGVLTFNAVREDGVFRGYIASNGTATALPPLTTRTDATYVMAVSNTGVVVGGADNDLINCSEGGGCSGQSRAVIFGNGGATDLGVLPGHTQSAATAINSQGVIVGWSGNAVWGGASFIYENGTMRNLNVSADSSEPVAINDAGQIAGTYWRGSLGRGSWVIDNGQVDYISLGNAETSVVDLNNAGQLIGNSGSWNAEHAWIRENGEITLLDDLLVEEGWRVVRVNDLNDAGQIVAEVIRPDGQYAFAVLTPVPEAGTSAMFAGGLAVLALWRRRSGRHPAWQA